MESALRNLRQCGFMPDLVIDVGAYQGKWTLMARGVWPNARFFMIEAQRSKEPFLASIGDYEIALLGERPRPEVEFYLGETGSTRYREVTAFQAKMQLTRMPMTTLDAVMRKHNVGGKMTLLKLDVQGSELDVLAGAHDVLGDVEVVLLEASIVHYNQGAPRIGELLPLLTRMGFELWDVADALRFAAPNGASVLGQMDLIFVRKDSALTDFAANIVHDLGKKG